MKASDYIVHFLEKEGVKDVFGIPGVGCGHLTDSLRLSRIKNHLVYHEQAAAFAASAYGQASQNIGVSYATAGPGATNLITGIANAYVDSVPCLFIVGDKDLPSLRGGLGIRQKASQEVDIVNMTRAVTKWSHQIKKKEELRFSLEKALAEARGGRPGPVLLDIPSDIQREEIHETEQPGFSEEKTEADRHLEGRILAAIERANSPLFLVGNSVKQLGLSPFVKALSSAWNIPIVTTLPCEDEFFDHPNYIGFIGLDGETAANEGVRKCDLLISLGARLNIKQVGSNRECFAEQAKILRIDIDREELSYRLGREEAICADLRLLLPGLLQREKSFGGTNRLWLEECLRQKTSSRCAPSVNRFGDKMMQALCEKLPEEISISLGIGSHRRWFLSRRLLKKGQRIYQSAGLASMGYALPAAIGVYHATGKPVVCIDGDGGLMMNIQELLAIQRDDLPITTFVMNNHCFGDIMEFQKKVFSGHYIGTTEATGYLSANFERLAGAFGMEYVRIEKPDDCLQLSFQDTCPRLIEVIVPSNE